MSGTQKTTKGKSVPQNSTKNVGTPNETNTEALSSQRKSKTPKTAEGKSTPLNSEKESLGPEKEKDIQNEVLPSQKKSKIEESEKKLCNRCNLLVDLEKHTCRPVFANLDRISEDFNLSHEQVELYKESYEEFRKMCPFSSDDDACKRCNLRMDSSVIDSHACNIKKGAIFNEFDGLFLRYGSNDITNDEYENWRDSKL